MINLQEGECGSGIDYLIHNLDRDRSFIFASDLLDSWRLYSRFFDSIIDDLSKLRLFEYNGCIKTGYKFFSSQDVYNVISGELFAEKICISLDDKSVFIYNDPSSNLSVSFLNVTVAQSYAEEWDDAFCEHLGNGGVGFGDEGKEYILQLIAKLSRKLPEEAARLSKISKCVNN